MDLFSTDLISNLHAIGWDSWGLLAANGPNFFESLMSTIFRFGKVAVGLGFVVFVHELGHFLAAKACGVKVEKFYVGFDFPMKLGPIKLPPRLFRFRRGETEYGVGTIPLGGYVKMLGQDDNPGNAEAEAERIRAGGQLDPRSYPAKPVWQRMIIISAGVTMNLIFGVILAAIAFGMGVSYTPTLVGKVMPGSPAWNAGVQPGGKVVGLGSIKHDESMYFRELQVTVVAHGLKTKTDPLRTVVKYGDENREYAIVPTGKSDKQGFASIGIAAVNSAKIPQGRRYAPNSAAATVFKDEKFDDAKIIKIDGVALASDEGTGQVFSTPVEVAEATRYREPFELTVELVGADGKTSEEKVVVPPQLEKTFGFQWQVGKVVGVMSGSPAAKAGLLAGDQIIKVNDADPTDSVGLWRTLYEAGEQCTLTVRRAPENGAAEELTLNLTSQPGIEDTGITAFNGNFGVARWGIAFEATSTLAGFNGAALQGDGLKAGDIIRKVNFIWPEGLEKDPDLPPSLTAEPFVIDPYHRPGSLTEISQNLPPGLIAHVTFERDNRVSETEVKLIELSDQYWPERGIMSSPFTRIHTASSFGEATKLGLNETYRRLTDVFDFLKMLVSGQISFKMFGGPIGIVRVAGSEANQGLPRLLLFLTLLSANLAVLNFLPIPALDGGHMMFLLAEWVRGKPVDEQLQMKLTIVGMLGLLALFLVASFNDISHLTLRK